MSQDEEEDDDDLDLDLLPADWTGVTSKPSAVQLINCGRQSDIFAASWVRESEPGSDGSPPSLSFALKVSPASVEASNEVHMLRKLRNSGHVVHYFGSKVVEGNTFLVMEFADCNLNDFTLRHAQRPGLPTKTWPVGEVEEDDDSDPDDELNSLASAREPMVLSVERSLLILIDVLRGAVDLEREGIVHGDLSEWNILMKEDRALIADFGIARILTGGDIGFGRGNLTAMSSAGAVPSAYRQPPETIGGMPTGPSNNVWAAGLVFSKMILGYIPTQKFVTKHNPGLRRHLWRREVRLQVGSMIRQAFSIREDEGFQDLDSDVQLLLDGMLERDTSKRWSAQGALAEAIQVAEARGLEVPLERFPAGMPGADVQVPVFGDTGEADKWQ